VLPQRVIKNCYLSIGEKEDKLMSSIASFIRRVWRLFDSWPDEKDLSVDKIWPPWQTF
jgi:hypothetical protein